MGSLEGFTGQVPNLQLSSDRMSDEDCFKELKAGRESALRKLEDCNQGKPYEEFDIRDELYGLALKYAPNARKQDLTLLNRYLKPKPGEVGVDLAAGTGFVSYFLAKKTGAQVYAVDPSRGQLRILEDNKISHEELGVLINTVPIAPDVSDFIDRVRNRLGIDLQGQLDYGTSYGGIHHSKNHENLFRNVALMLKEPKGKGKYGGRFVAADVGLGTALQRYFDDEVTQFCITGHEGNWLSVPRLEELCQDLPLELVKAQIEPVKWRFNRSIEAFFFFAGLHAYNNRLFDVLGGLEKYLNFHQVRDKNYYEVDWPMLFFDIRRTEGKVD